MRLEKYSNIIKNVYNEVRQWILKKNKAEVEIVTANLLIY